MRDRVAKLNRRVVALCVWCGLLTSMSTWAANESGVPSRTGHSAEIAPLIEFNIPAQPLSLALNRYASLTSRATLFRSELAAGRISGGVQGRYTPEAALSQLLEGTGLVFEKIDDGPANAFVLRAAGSSAASLQAALASAGDYPGLLQRRIWDALCASSPAAPGRYRALLRFQVDEEGQLFHARLLHSTGDARRDKALLNALDGVHMGAPPPSGMPQPLTMLVLPDDPSAPRAERRCHRDAPS